MSGISVVSVGDLPIRNPVGESLRRSLESHLSDSHYSSLFLVPIVQVTFRDRREERELVGYFCRPFSDNNQIALTPNPREKLHPKQRVFPGGVTKIPYDSIEGYAIFERGLYGQYRMYASTNKRRRA